MLQRAKATSLLNRGDSFVRITQLLYVHNYSGNADCWLCSNMQHKTNLQKIDNHDYKLQLTMLCSYHIPFRSKSAARCPIFIRIKVNGSIDFALFVKDVTDGVPTKNLLLNFTSVRQPPQYCLKTHHYGMYLK